MHLSDLGLPPPVAGHCWVRRPGAERLVGSLAHRASEQYRPQEAADAPEGDASNQHTDAPQHPYALHFEAVLNGLESSALPCPFDPLEAEPNGKRKPGDSGHYGNKHPCDSERYLP